jgi:threonine dehydrogenase-like Zn-dependent dehydrogenase
VQFAKAAGANVIVLDINESRLNFCRQQFKVEHTLFQDVSSSADKPSTEDILAKLSALTDGDLPTAVFDATGNPESMAAAFKWIAHGGRMVFVGLYQGDYTFNDPDFHRRELTLLATRNSTSNDFRRIINLMENGKIDTRPWITHRATCDAMLEQFPSWLEPKTGVIKAMVEF